MKWRGGCQGAQSLAGHRLCSVPECGWQERHCQGQPSCGRALLAREQEGAGDDGVKGDGDI